jgi:hypothetical protein
MEESEDRTAALAQAEINRQKIRIRKMTQRIPLRQDITLRHLQDIPIALDPILT